MSAAKYTELKTTARDCKEYCPRRERQQPPAWQFSLPPSATLGEGQGLAPRTGGNSLLNSFWSLRN